METVAGNYLRAGDLANAELMYTSLAQIHPKYVHMARCCRVLNDPIAVPLPHRHQDMCEALLEPMIPPEVLIGEELTVDAVQKRYQRLVVHVHPDKNPHPKAADAFLRLSELRTRAVAMVEQKRAEKEARQAARQLPAGATVAKPRRKKGQPSYPSTSSEPLASATSSAADMPNLKGLRDARITLSSLKRKELDDEALAETLFSATQRHVHHTDLDIDSGRDDDDAGADALASTVPDMARHTLHSGGTTTAASAKGKLNGPRGRPTSHNGKRLAPLKSVGKSAWVDAAPNGRDLLARRAGAVPKVAPRKPTSPRPPLSSPVHVSSEDAVVEEVLATETGSRASASLSQPSSSFGVAERSVTQTRDGAGAAPSVASAATAPTEDSREADDVDNNNPDDDGFAALRDQINSLINRVGTMKRNSGGIRLTADLSYAGYERQKESERSISDDAGPS